MKTLEFQFSFEMLIGYNCSSAFLFFIVVLYLLLNNRQHDVSQTDTVQYEYYVNMRQPVQTLPYMKCVERWQKWGKYVNMRQSCLLYYLKPGLLSFHMPGPTEKKLEL